MPGTSRAGVVRIYIFIYESLSLCTLLLVCFPEFPEQKKPARNYSEVNPSTIIDKQKAKDRIFPVRWPFLYSILFATFNKNELGFIFVL